MKYEFIAAEGLDATGKTEITKGLARRVGGAYYCCPPESIKPIRAAMVASHPKISFEYYLFGNRVASHDISELLRSQHVFGDRYVYSTVAHHSALLKGDIEVPKIDLLPDQIIYTTASFDVIERRLDERGDRKELETMDFLIMLKARFDSLFSGMENVVRIDTCHTTVDEAVEEVLSRIKI